MIAGRGLAQTNHKRRLVIIEDKLKHVKSFSLLHFELHSCVTIPGIHQSGFDESKGPVLPHQGQMAQCPPPQAAGDGLCSAILWPVLDRKLENTPKGFQVRWRCFTLMHCSSYSKFLVWVAFNGGKDASGRSRHGHAYRRHIASSSCCLHPKANLIDKPTQNLYNYIQAEGSKIQEVLGLAEVSGEFW